MRNTYDTYQHVVHEKGFIYYSFTFGLQIWERVIFIHAVCRHTVFIGVGAMQS